MIDCLLEALIDTIKVIPFLFLTFIVLEYIEHKFTNKNKKMLAKNKKYGPVVGGVLGALPQCGFGTVAANLFSARVITMGTLIAVFLSTSDEMLPIMISEQANIWLILKIIGFKLIVGIIIGYIIDLIYRKKQEKAEIHEFCEHEHCDCEHDGILVSSLKHTLKIGIFILLANIIIGLLLFYIGEDKISDLLLHHNLLTYFLSSLIGLIPNCAGSVIITELFLSNMITIGTLLAGLLTGSGIGILVLFRVNKSIKENLTILGLLYFIGVIIGIIVDLII